MGYRKEMFGRLREAMALNTPEPNLEQLREEASTCLVDFVGLEPTVWDDLPAALAGQTEGNFIAVSPNGKLVAFALHDGTIRIRCDTRSIALCCGRLRGRKSVSVPRKPWPVFSRNGRYLFVGEQQQGPTAWDLDTFQSIPIVGGPQTNVVFRLLAELETRNRAKAAKKEAESK